VKGGGMGKREKKHLSSLPHTAPTLLPKSSETNFSRNMKSKLIDNELFKAHYQP